MAEKSLTLRPWNSPVRRSFLPSCFPQILLHYPPHSCNFMFSPSKKQKVDKQSKQTNQKRKKKKINKKTHIQSSFYVSQLLLGVGPTLAHSGRAQQDSAGENCFPFLSSSIAPAFLVEVPPLWGSLQTPQPQGVGPRKAGKTSDSARLSGQFLFKLLESDTGWFILGISKHSTMSE